LIVRSSGCVTDRLPLLELLLGSLELDFLEVDRYFLADFFFSFVLLFLALGYYWVFTQVSVRMLKFSSGLGF
jgi:hypothetical protein